MQKLLRLPDVIARTGLSRSTIYETATRFPKPVKLSARAVAWVESEVDEWIESRMTARIAA